MSSRSVKSFFMSAILLAIGVVGLVVIAKALLPRSHFGREMLAPFLFERLRTAKAHIHEFERLTKEESVGQVFSPLGRPGAYQIAPEATSALKKIIENDELFRYRRYAIELFALGGQAEDVPYLVNFLHANRNKMFDIYHQNAIQAAIKVFASLAIRDLPDAKIKLRAMCDRAFWEDLDFRWPGHLSPEKEVDDLVVVAIQSYAITEPDDLEVVVRSALGAVRDEQRRADMKFQLDLPQLRALHKEWELKVYWIIPQSTRLSSKANFNGDMDSPMPLFLEK